VALLQKLGPDAKLLSGGQSLIPMMKLRLLLLNISLISIAYQTSTHNRERRSSENRSTSSLCARGWM